MITPFFSLTITLQYSIHAIDVLVIGGLVVYLIWVIIMLIKRMHTNKGIATSIKPTRLLNEEDLKAIQYLDLDADLTVVEIKRRLPKGDLEKICFWSISFCTSIFCGSIFNI